MVRRESWTLGLAFAVGLLAACPGTLRADEKSAEQTLRAKGLTRRISCFCLAKETELIGLLSGRRSEAGKRKKAVDDSEEAAGTARAKAEEWERNYRQCRLEYDQLNVQLQALPPTAPQHNRIVTRMNIAGCGTSS